MNRYILFEGMDYYQNGGAYDLIGSYDSINKAKKYRLMFLKKNHLKRTDKNRWAHIYDFKEGKIVLECVDGKWIEARTIFQDND